MNSAPAIPGEATPRYTAVGERMEPASLTVIIPTLCRVERRAELCPFCGGRQLRSFAVRRKSLSLIECQRCIAAWQWPLTRSESESVDCFSQKYAAAKQGTYYDESRRRAVAALAVGFVASVCEPQRLLDIGAGDGVFLRQSLQRGWRVQGVEPSSGAVRRYREQGGGDELLCGTLDNLDPDVRFDVITAWDVIEHVEDGLEFIQNAARHLAPGGCLILETGNYQSAGRIDAGSDWWAYDPDHRWYYTPPTLRQLCEAAGFTRFELAPRALRPWAEDPAYRGPSWRWHLRCSLCAPHRVVDTWRKFFALRQAARLWPQWAGLEIITLAAWKS
jgi:2-polyprenyl-3-methyl-5-hydroxy-6-metoxy-1,4-benzoquinol methylase